MNKTKLYIGIVVWLLLVAVWTAVIANMNSLPWQKITLTIIFILYSVYGYRKVHKP